VEKKMKKLILVCLIFWCFSIVAFDQIIFNENVLSYLNQVENNVSDCYRSGGGYKVDVRSKNSIWNSDFMPEYKVVQNEKVIKSIEKQFFEKNTTGAYRSFVNLEKSYVRFEKIAVPVPSDLVIPPSHKITVNDYIENAKQKINDLFGTLLEGYEYSIHGVEKTSCYSCDAKYQEERIASFSHIMEKQQGVEKKFLLTE